MNKVMLMGRLTRDPELRQTPNGVAVASFTIAVDRRFKSASGERETDFIPCTTWRQQAEFVSRYFKQGNRILVVGALQVRPYEKNGEKRSYTEVVVDEVYFTESKGVSSQNNATSQFASQAYNATANNKKLPTNNVFAEDDDSDFFTLPSNLPTTGFLSDDNDDADGQVPFGL